MGKAIDSPYLTTNEAAQYLRLKPRTLNNMRWRGEGPRYRKHGGKVLYHRRDLEGWSFEKDCGEGTSYARPGELAQRRHAR